MSGGQFWLMQMVFNIFISLSMTWTIFFDHHMVFIRFSYSYVLPFSCTTDSRRCDSVRDSEKMTTASALMKIIFLVIPLHLGWQWCSMCSLGEDSMDWQDLSIWKEHERVKHCAQVLNHCWISFNFKHVLRATAKSAKWQVDDISTEIFLSALDHVPQRYMADKTNKLYHMYEDATSADGNKELLWMETKTGVIAI